MQRNEVDASLSSSHIIGFGTPELWQRLSIELDGKTQLEKPHVSKKVLLKAIRMQTDAMRFMVDEFDRLREKMAELERENKGTQKYVERVNSKLITLQGQVEDMGVKMYEVEVQQEKQGDQLRRIDDVAALAKANHDEIRQCNQRVDEAGAIHAAFAAQADQQLSALRDEQEVTKQFAMKLEDRMNTEEKELFLDSNHILHEQLSLAMWIENVERDNRKKDEAIREFSDKMARQGKNVQEMMLETRRTLDDNTCAVEDVQRLLLDKADRARVDEIIETKYEEICHQIDKALAGVLGEEDEFKRVSQELQQLITHLSESKADKRDLLEVKEQVLYDSRVRQQVENLRSFIDLKMNREDVFSALKNKADKDEMLALLKTLSDGYVSICVFIVSCSMGSLWFGLVNSMNASILHAQKSMQEPESAFLTGKHLGNCNHTSQQSGSILQSGNQKRSGTTLPSIDRDRCLSCNSTLRDGAPINGGPLVNRNPHPMAPTFGGGFQLPGPGSVDKSSLRAGNSTSKPMFSPRTAAGMAAQQGNGRVSLSESASEGWVCLARQISRGLLADGIWMVRRFLLGVDGRVYQGDPELIALQLQDRSNSRTHKLPQAAGAQRRQPATQEPTRDDEDDSA